MDKNKTKLTDCIGRPIPDWTDVSIFIPVSHGDLNIDGNKFLMNHRYLRGLTDVRQSSGDKTFLKCKIKNKSKILNMHDRKDYLVATRLAGNFDPAEIDDGYLYYISLGGYAGVFYPTVPGVFLCDPARHIKFIGIERIQ